MNHLDFRRSAKCPKPDSSLDKGYQEPSTEELKAAITQIEQEKKPLIALRYTAQSDIFARQGELEEHVYEYGKPSAARYLSPHNDAEFRVYLGNGAAEYRDKIDNSGNDNVSLIVRDAQGFDHDIPLGISSPDYEAVVKKLRSIDWDRVPNFPFNAATP